MNRDEFIHMAGEAGENFFQVWPLPQAWEDFLERFGKLVAAAEREACIRDCDSVDVIGADDCIAAIRARGQE